MNLLSILKRLAASKLKSMHASSNGQGQMKISRRVKDCTDQIKQILSNPADLIIREFKTRAGHPCAIVCIDGLVDKKLVNGEILKTLQLNYMDLSGSDSGMHLKAYIESESLPAQEVEAVHSMDDAILAVLSGDTALFIEGAQDALIIGTKGWKSRSIEEPQTESLIRGPRDGFTEDLFTNTASIRRKIRDPNLRFDAYKIGRRSQKDVLVAYIDGIVHPQLVEEVKKRLKTIDIDDPEGSGTIEHWISDNYLSPFPQILATERPDKVAAAIMQGRVAILVDTTPFQLILPITLVSCFQSPEDVYQHWTISSLLRILRMTAAFIATFLPALYIALVEYHHGMLPSKLAFSIAGAREGVPFPAVVEAFLMEATFELLREAGIRLPKAIGQTIGIVGGLVIGEAAVSAGIVSPIMVIVVAITAISSFTLPVYTFAISLRMLRFAVMLAASIFGLYGVILTYIMINIHIVNLKSFGIPYSTPFAPLFVKDFKDVLIRAPITQMNERPKMLQTENPKRMKK